MHIYIKQTLTFELFDESLKKYNLDEKQSLYLKNLFYSIVFHKILDLTLGLMPKQKHKEFIIKSLHKEPDTKIMGEFLEKYIKSHKEEFKRIAKECESEIIEVLLKEK